MCELLICVKDRGTSGDLLIDSHAPQQGDVVAVQPDGWVWGLAELGEVVPGNPNGNHDFFRIVKMPNMTEAEAEYLLAPELDADPLNPSPYLQYRMNYVDKTKIPPGPLYDYLQDDSRTDPFFEDTTAAVPFGTLTSIRPPIPF